MKTGTLACLVAPGATRNEAAHSITAYRVWKWTILVRRMGGAERAASRFTCIASELDQCDPQYHEVFILNGKP